MSYMMLYATQLNLYITILIKYYIY